jgi:hypothetical protein
MALCDRCNQLCENDGCRERPFPCEKHPDLTTPLLLSSPDRERCVGCWLELGHREHTGD